MADDVCCRMCLSKGLLGPQRASRLPHHPDLCLSTLLAGLTWAAKMVSTWFIEMLQMCCRMTLCKELCIVIALPSSTLAIH